MFAFLGRFVAAHPGKIICAWIVLAICLTHLAPDWKKQSPDDDIRFLPDRYPSVRAHRLLQQAFPKEVAATRVILAIERETDPLTTADFALIDEVVARLTQLRQERSDLPLSRIISYQDGPLGKRLISNDRQCTLVQIALTTPYMAAQTKEAVEAIEQAIQPIMASAGPGGPRLFVTGPAGIGRDLVKASGRSLDNTTWATIILVIVVLMLVYRSPLLALIPLLTIGLATWVALQLIALATLIPGVYVVNVSQVFCIVILFGAGTDYCLFLISRYREELELGQEPKPGVARAVRSVGGALAASAATVICGLGTMGFAEFGKIRCAGPVIAIGLVVGLVASLTLTPALLRLGKRSVFWPQKIRYLAGPPSRKFWNAISSFIVRRPITVFIASIVPLIGLAFLGLRITPSFRPTGDLSPKSTSLAGMVVLQKHFTAGETGPLTIMLTSPNDWKSPEGKQLIEQLTAGFGFLPNVGEVRSLSQPLGKKNAGTAFALADDLARIAAEPHYLAKIVDGEATLHVTRLEIVFRSDPFEAESMITLRQIERWLNDLLPAQSSRFGPVRAETSGVTVHSRDIGIAIGKDRRLINVLVAVSVFLILLVLVRKLWLAGYLLGTVLLSYFATLGLTALFAMWLTGRPFGDIEWRVPFFLFVILVAVGEDYNILLVTRILQERKRHGMIEGVRRGLATTGGTITACGLIMAGTFGTLLLADLSTLKQIGFALAVGVLLDTFLVRTFLVPSFLVIVWRDADENQRHTVDNVERQSVPHRIAA